MKEIAMILCLMVLAIFDLKKKQLPVWSLIIMGILGMGCVGLQIIGGETNWAIWMLRWMPGLFFLGIAKLTDQQIGYGDGIVIFLLGCFIGARELILALMLACLINFVISAVLLLTKKGNRKTEIPFVPSMLVGVIGLVILW